jgi:hypothetical protein
MGCSKKAYLKKLKESTLRKKKLGCVICGFKRVLESHHILYKSKGGQNKCQNLICLCPNHHKLLHLNKLIPFEIDLLNKHRFAKNEIIKTDLEAIKREINNLCIGCGKSRAEIDSKEWYNSPTDIICRDIHLCKECYKLHKYFDFF